MGTSQRFRFAAAYVRSPMRRLFNLVQAPDGGIEDPRYGLCNINYHAVYIHHQQWAHLLLSAAHH